MLLDPVRGRPPRGSRTSWRPCRPPSPGWPAPRRTARRSSSPAGRTRRAAPRRARGPARALQADLRRSGWAPLPPGPTRSRTGRTSRSRRARVTSRSTTRCASSPGASRRSRCTCTWRCRARRRRCARCAGCGCTCRCCSRSRRTRRSGRAATPVSRPLACRSSAPSRASASRAGSPTTPSTSRRSTCCCAAARSPSRRSCGGTCGCSRSSARSRCGSWTPRRASPTTPRSPRSCSALVRLEAREGFADEAIAARPEVLDENRFLATRDGMRAEFLDPQRDRPPAGGGPPRGAARRVRAARCGARLRAALAAVPALARSPATTASGCSPPSRRRHAGRRSAAVSALARDFSAGLAAPAVPSARRRAAGLDLVLVVRVALVEVGEPHAQAVVLVLPDVAELVDDQVVGDLAEGRLQQDQAAHVVAGEAAEPGQPEQPARCAGCARCRCRTGRGVELQPVQPRRGPRERRALRPALSAPPRTPTLAHPASARSRRRAVLVGSPSNAACAASASRARVARPRAAGALRVPANAPRAGRRRQRVPAVAREQPLDGGRGGRVPACGGGDLRRSDPASPGEGTPTWAKRCTSAPEPLRSADARHDPPAAARRLAGGRDRQPAR